MKIYLVSFATPNFYEAQNRLDSYAKKYGYNHIRNTFEDIKKTEFYEKNKALLDQKKGAGYYAWKPYIILKAIEKAKDGDVIIYCDSGIQIIRDLKELIPICQKEKGVLVFGNITYAIDYTKMDCFIGMGCEILTDKYLGAHIAFGGCQIYIKNKFSIKFVRRWLMYATIPSIIDDSITMPNYQRFIQHSHDQSILTNLVVRYGIKLHRNIDSFTNDPEYPNDKYPLYLYVDRLQKRTFIQRQILNIKMLLPLEMKQNWKRFKNSWKDHLRD